MPNTPIPCRRCGACCLPGLALVHDEDMTRWKQEGRDDILHIVEHYLPLWAGDHLFHANGHSINGCPFLQMMDDLLSCAIYETRPDVCRRFTPGQSAMCSAWRGTRSAD